MHVTCQKAALSHALATVISATTPRGTLPILANVLLSAEPQANANAEPGRLILAASNLEIGIQCQIEAQVEQEGSAALPARLLADLITLLPQQQEITIVTQQDTQTSQITSAETRAQIKGADPDDFPCLPQPDERDPDLALAAVDLSRLIKAVSFAAATAQNAPQPVWTGILMSVTEDAPERLHAVASNGIVLARASVPLARPARQPFSQIVPARTLKELATLLTTRQGQEVTIHLPPHAHQVLFQAEHLLLVSRLLEGPYPAYRKMLPQDVGLRAEVDRAQLITVTRTAALFAIDDSVVCLTFHPQEGQVHAEARSTDLGIYTTMLPATYEQTSADQQQDLTIRFNVAYIAQILAACHEAETVACDLQTSTQPGYFRPGSGSETIDALYVLMPMQRKSAS